MSVCVYGLEFGRASFFILIKNVVSFGIFMFTWFLFNHFCFAEKRMPSLIILKDLTVLMLKCMMLLQKVLGSIAFPKIPLIRVESPLVVSRMICFTLQDSLSYESYIYFVFITLNLQFFLIWTLYFENSKRSLLFF